MNVDFTPVEVESDEPEETDTDDDFDFSGHLQVDELVSYLFLDQAGVLNKPMFQMCLMLFSRGEDGKHSDDIQAFNRWDPLGGFLQKLRIDPSDTAGSVSHIASPL